MFKKNNGRRAGPRPRTRIIALVPALSILLVWNGNIFNLDAGNGKDALSQEPELRLAKWSVDSGGGASGSEGYALRGVVGQPDAGTLEGDRITLSGGFLGPVDVAIVEPTPPGPTPVEPTPTATRLVFQVEDTIFLPQLLETAPFNPPETE